MKSFGGEMFPDDRNVEENGQSGKTGQKLSCFSMRIECLVCSMSPNIDVHIFITFLAKSYLS